jgi:two-component system, OmpR family, alkaline phosphatase synthesis response regulator PhoP
MSKTILIVDDEQDIINLLKFNLLSEGYRTLTAQDGEAAIKTALAGKPDLIILDVMLPKMDGWAVIRELRNCNETRQTPIIFLTAKDSEIDEVVGLELGADDYIVKPIAIRKLLVRIKMALRKAAANRVVNQDRIVFDDIQIDPAGFAVFVGSSRLTLTKKEFEILLYLAQRPGRVITREMLLDVVWGDSVVVIDRTIDVHIRKIREKLGPERQHLIETIKGVGYRFKAPEA